MCCILATKVGKEIENKVFMNSAKVGVLAGNEASEGTCKPSNTHCKQRGRQAKYLQTLKKITCIPIGKSPIKK